MDQFKYFVPLDPATFMSQLKTKEETDGGVPSSQAENAEVIYEDESFDIASAVAAILEDATDEVTPSTSSGVSSHKRFKKKSRLGSASSIRQTLVPKSSTSSATSSKSQKGFGRKTRSTIRDSMTSIYQEGNPNISSTVTAKPRSRGNEPITANLKDEATALESTGNISNHRLRSASTPAGHRIQQHPNPLRKNASQADVIAYLGRVNSYIKRLGYHHVGEPGIRVITHLSLRHHMETARQLIKSGENIKCLHALLLGIHLTNCTPQIERFPINFKSKLNGKEFRHVVLGIYLYGAYGALGLSRDPGLQDKPATYSRISDLLIDYAQSYEKSGHVLIEIKVGGIISRDTTSQSAIPWKIGVLQMAKYPNMEKFAGEADKLARLLKGQMGQACIRHLRPTESTMPVSSFITRPEVMASPVASLGNIVPSAPVEGSKESQGISVASSKLSIAAGPRSTIPTTATKSGTGNKAKKKKVLKHKRFAEP